MCFSYGYNGCDHFRKKARKNVNVQLHVKTLATCMCTYLYPILKIQQVWEACSVFPCKTIIYQELNARWSQKNRYTYMDIEFTKNKHAEIWNDFIKYMRVNASRN